MPGLDTGSSAGLSVSDVFSPLHDGHRPLDVAADLWLYPASAPVSALVVAACAWALRRRGLGRVGVAWLVALVGGSLVELTTKTLLHRPPLHLRGVHVVEFDHALPSGHTLRAALLAATIAYAWPRTGRVAVAWAITVAFVLVAAGWHTPTDVAGGLLLAGALALTVSGLAVRVESRATG